MLLTAAEFQTGIATVGGIAPEPALMHRTAQPVALLIGVAEQQNGRYLQVLKGEQMGQRAVHGGQVTDDPVELRPDQALTTKLLWNGQGQQAAVAQ